jgi:GT2 family glycosyltransferase
MIGLILVTYAHWPEKLMASVEASGIPVTWYIHHHGSEPGFADRVQQLASRPNVKVHMHRQNRGLSRSWNEGLREAYEDGCELVLLVNDDLHFVEGGFQGFIDFARAESDYGLACLNGLETGGSPLAGSVIMQGLGCGIVMPLALDRIGYFDENFRPAYYEDVDFGRRFHLSGIKMIVADGVLVEHERSKTTRENPEIQAANAEVMRVNGGYYARKWGGLPHHETFDIPFNHPKFDRRID